MANNFQCEYMTLCIFRMYKDVHSFDSDRKYEHFKGQFGPELDKKNLLNIPKDFWNTKKKRLTKPNF